MLEVFLALCRFVQYSGAAILFGSSLLLLRSFSVSLVGAGSSLRWTKQLLLAAALALLTTTILGFVGQAAGLAGSLEIAMKPEALNAALWEMDFGKSSLARAILAVLALIGAILLPPGARLLWICIGLGTLICISFAWMGHGAATQGNFGLIHLVSDILHILAAAGWIGALVIFCFVSAQLSAPLSIQKTLCAALASFSGWGIAFVAVIIISGLANSAFLVGWNVDRIFSTRYGQVLITKLILFAVMVAFAAANRFRHTPRLEEALRTTSSSVRELANLRRSIATETVIGALTLTLVSWLGMLAPAIGG